ncbi:MAG: peptidoglycan DD-metalloendopeptidase family protein [Pseudobdellovibrionaceae bacterium]|jgi:septal ring factor EnvC (AmiA/AmiB activator)|nr:peptidoglycan DD-metalloendopeptidase family protein [Pseudobdellovibrionaceae bacterium]
MRFYLCLVLLFFFLSGTAIPALAETPPLPPRKNTSPQDVREQLAVEQKNKKELEFKAKSIEKDMKGLKNDLVSLTGRVQDQERELSDLETRLKQLDRDKTNIQSSLTKQKKSIADLVMALERIRRLPPETLIARPDAPLETAQAATVLSAILPELDRKSKKLRLDLEELEAIKTELESKKKKAEEASEILKTDQKKLDAAMDQRKSALKDARSEMAAKEVSITKLSQTAKDLDDLIAKVEQRNKDLEARTGNTASMISPKKVKQPEMSAADIRSIGSNRMPVNGVVLTKFGERDDIGAVSQGITIEARPGALVSAPVGGTVRYAGPFKKYGSIVLIQHANKFHSLVAGLGKIDAFVGQKVDAGEPLGRLPDYTGRLYYELRYRGEPVNPSKQFSKLQ